MTEMSEPKAVPGICAQSAVVETLEENKKTVSTQPVYQPTVLPTPRKRVSTFTSDIQDNTQVEALCSKNDIPNIPKITVNNTIESIVKPVTEKKNVSSTWSRWRNDEKSAGSVKVKIAIFSSTPKDKAT